MDEPAEPETELHVANVQSAAETIQSAGTTDCGEGPEATGVTLLLGMEAGTDTSPVYGLATDLTARAKASCCEEPGAGKLHAGICEGGAGQPASLPRPRT